MLVGYGTVTIALSLMATNAKGYVRGIIVVMWVVATLWYFGVRL